MAVSDTLQLEKWAVADSDDWKNLPESVQYQITQQFYFTPKRI